MRDLKEFLAEAVAADASFAHVYANKEKAQLAYYEWSARWNFTTKLSGLPAALKKEKEKQLREAAIARGEVVPDATVAPAKKKIMLADFKAQADRLYPDGIAAPAVAVPPPPPAAVAPLPPAAVGPLPPRGRGAAGRGPGRRLRHGSGDGRRGVKQHRGQEERPLGNKGGSHLPCFGSS